jgi:hypothetical protein
MVARRLVVPLLAVALVLAACGSDDHTQAPADMAQWTEPAWMVKDRQDAEELSSKIRSCLLDQGWASTVERDGSFSGEVGLGDEANRFMEDQRVCASSVREEMELTRLVHDDAFFRTLYARTLDTRDCLVAQGVKVSEPPSEDAWIEAIRAGDATVWAPFDDVQGTDDEFYALFDVCVQAGREVTR